MKILKIIVRKFIAFWFIIEDNIVLNIILFNMSAMYRNIYHEFMDTIQSINNAAIMCDKIMCRTSIGYHSERHQLYIL